MKAKNLILFSSMLIVLGLMSCGENKTETSSPPATKKPAFNSTTSKQSTSKFDNISSKMASIPKYNFGNIKDPFYTTLLQTPTKEKKVTQIKGKPLATQKYEIERYKLIGIMIKKQGNTAIFEDPENKGWVLKEGNYIGNEGARIKKILTDSVIIEEPVVDATGKVKYVERSITIKKAP